MVALMLLHPHIFLKLCNKIPASEGDNFVKFVVNWTLPIQSQLHFLIVFINLYNILPFDGEMRNLGNLDLEKDQIFLMITSPTLKFLYIFFVE